MAKRTLDSFFKPAASKKAKTEEVEENRTYTSHSSYPFPIADLPSHVAVGLSHATPEASPKDINNQPQLDLLYFQPFIPSPTAKELFKFLRQELPFYRVQYTIRRANVETIVNTPRFTTVFGVDETSQFIHSSEQNELEVVDSKTNDPVRLNKYQYTPRPIPPCLDVLRQRVEAETRASFNFCLVNYYASGDDSIAYHSDDERFLGTNPTIASLSLGAQRDFMMKHKPKENGDESGSKPLKFTLAPGDMIVMRGETQANWLHSIPKRKAEAQGRINITFRKAVIPGGTNNYYNYNVGSGAVYRWDEGRMQMVKQESKDEN